MGKKGIFGQCYMAEKMLLDMCKDEYFEHIKNDIKAGLADCIFTQIEDEGEKIVSLSDMKAKEIPNNYCVEYKRYIIFEDLIRCKDCVFFNQYQGKGMFCTRVVGAEYPRKSEDYCSDGVLR